MYYWFFLAAIAVFVFSNFQESSESELIFKASNNMPFCVKPETAKRLVERSWGTTINLEKAKTSLPSSNMFEVIPAASGTALNFYVYDDDLNTSPNGVDTISTDGLVEATINGVQIEVPSKMVETSPSSGKFYLRISLPDTVNGEDLDQDDIVLVKYNDQSDAAGDTRVV